MTYSPWCKRVRTCESAQPPGIVGEEGKGGGGVDSQAHFANAVSSIFHAMEMMAYMPNDIEISQQAGRCST